MESITVRRHGVDIECPIYEEGEAISLGLSFVPWRRAVDSEERQWVQDDDGYVSALFWARSFLDGAGRTRRQVLFPFGRRYHSKQPFGWLSVREEPRTWVDREIRNTRGRRAIRLYVQMIAEKGRLDPEDWDQLGIVYRADQQVPALTVKRFIRQKKVQRMVTEVLAQTLAKMAVNPEMVVEKYEEVREEAMAAGNLTVAKSILDKYADMLDMKPDKVEVKTTQIEGSFSMDDLLGASEPPKELDITVTPSEVVG